MTADAPSAGKARGFVSPNHTQTPNDLFDHFLPELGMTELKVILAIIRLTLGFHRVEVRASLTKLQKMTGLSRHGVLDGAKAAEGRELVRRVQDGRVTLWRLNVTEQALDEMVKPVHQAKAVVHPVHRSGASSAPPSVKERRKKGTTRKRVARASSSADESLFPIASALAEVCRMSLEANRGRLFREAKELSKASLAPTADLVREHYGAGGWWYLSDWRGLKAQPPSPSAVRQTWGQWTQAPGVASAQLSPALEAARRHLEREAHGGNR